MCDGEHQSRLQGKGKCSEVCGLDVTFASRLGAELHQVALGTQDERAAYDTVLRPPVHPGRRRDCRRTGRQAFPRERLVASQAATDAQLGQEPISQARAHEKISAHQALPSRKVLPSA